MLQINKFWKTVTKEKTATKILKPRLLFQKFLFVIFYIIFIIKFTNNLGTTMDVSDQ